MKNKIAELIKELGISAEDPGYMYIIEAISMAVEEFDYVYNITKALYPDVAYRFETNAHNIESHIRRAITRGWPLAPNEIKYKIFKNTVVENTIPTNGKFIATIADYIKRNGTE